MDSTLKLVEDVVRAAASSLGKSLGSYWPTCGDQGAHERNISLHVAHAFLNEGYATFGESHGEKKGAKVRFDLVAISKSQDHIIACEFKQLWTSSEAESMKEDFHRLNEFKPLPWFPEGRPVIGVIAAFATQEKLAVPFGKDGQRDGLVTQRDPTQQFCQELPQGRRLGCVPLFPGKSPSLQEPAFVYAVFEIASGSAVPSRS